MKLTGTLTGSDERDPLLTQDEVLARLRVKRTKFYKIRTEGELPPVRLGARCLRWRESEVEAFIKSRQITSS